MIATTRCERVAETYFSRGGEKILKGRDTRLAEAATLCCVMQRRWRNPFAKRQQNDRLITQFVISSFQISGPPDCGLQSGNLGERSPCREDYRSSFRGDGCAQVRQGARPLRQNSWLRLSDR